MEEHAARACVRGTVGRAWMRATVLGDPCGIFQVAGHMIGVALAEHESVGHCLEARIVHGGLVRLSSSIGAKALCEAVEAAGSIERGPGGSASGIERRAVGKREEARALLAIECRRALVVVGRSRNHAAV